MAPVYTCYIITKICPNHNNIYIFEFRPRPFRGAFEPMTKSTVNRPSNKSSNWKTRWLIRNSYAFILWICIYGPAAGVRRRPRVGPAGAVQGWVGHGPGEAAQAAHCGAAENRWEEWLVAQRCYFGKASIQRIWKSSFQRISIQRKKIWPSLPYEEIFFCSLLGYSKKWEYGWA